MSSGWIVTSHNFVAHKTPELAFKERDRLAGKFPDKTFRVVRVKTDPVPRPAAEDISTECMT